MTILVLAPHADDETLGVGGTIAKRAAAGQSVTVAVLTGHGEDEHPLWNREFWRGIRGECREACEVLGVDSLLFRELPAACLDAVPNWRINGVVEELISEVGPNELYVPYVFDLHKDHAAIANAASVASRPYSRTGLGISRILAYETLSETHLQPPYFQPAFQPNVYIDISETIDKKVEALQAYKSQMATDHGPRSIETVRALARFRGAHMGTSAAEGFVLLGEYDR